MSVKPVVPSAAMAASCRGAPGRPTSNSMTPRLFVEGELAAGVEAALRDAQVHYLRHVLRRADGAPLRLFNGRDGEWSAAFEGRGKKAGIALVDQPLRAQEDEPDL